MSPNLGIEIWSSLNVICYSILSKRPRDNNEEFIFCGLDNGPLLSIYSFLCFYLDDCFHEKSKVHHSNFQVSNFSNMKVKHESNLLMKLCFLRNLMWGLSSSKSLGLHEFLKIHDNCSITTQFGFVFVVLMNFIIQIILLFVCNYRL